jgi:hypothetical protein
LASSAVKRNWIKDNLLLALIAAIAKLLKSASVEIAELNNARVLLIVIVVRLATAANVWRDVLPAANVLDQLSAEEVLAFQHAPPIVIVVVVPFAATKFVLLDVLLMLTAFRDSNVIPQWIHAKLDHPLALPTLTVLQECFAKIVCANLVVRRTLIALPKLSA